MKTPEHNHFADGNFRGVGSDNPCARCILEHAAPDMYNCLEEMVNLFEGFARACLREKYTQSEAEKRARAALLKQKGGNYESRMCILQAGG